MNDRQKTSPFLKFGEMGTRMQALDWAETPVGAVESWSQSLKSTVRTLLGSRYPMILLWEQELIQIYNDAYINLIGTKHPYALGRSIRETQAESWNVIGPMITEVMTTGVPNWVEDQMLAVNRSGYNEEAHFSLSYSAVEDDEGVIRGMLCVCSEVTQQVLGERRLRLQRDLAARAGETRGVEATCQDILAAIAESPLDVPFALIYLHDPDEQTLRLSGRVRLSGNEAIAPSTVLLTDATDRWSLAEVMAGQTAIVTGLDHDLTLPGGPWNESVQQAIALPIPSSNVAAPLGVLICGISPNRALDEGYQSFYELLAGQVSVSIRNAQAYEEERRRAEMLAEIDRAKTVFFSNVSHEFRTPLTLMLNPLEDVLQNGNLPADEREQIAIAHRNSQRLLKLVNTLLDFSRIEAGRIQAVYEPTDLASLTANLASVFRSAIEKAGLQLAVDCPPLPEPVYVDRAMWEKIVLNLLSNAFKFTFKGQISVTLHSVDGAVELVIKDTGTGIPDHELPRLFERFHRVVGAQGRSYEGSGIGLSLVQELVKLHGGTATVSSAVGEGSAFVVQLPLGCAHLPSAQIQAVQTQTPTASGTTAYVEEALGWVAERGEKVVALPRRAAARILLADDNADMRQYLQRLLSEHYDVEAVADGQAAVEAIRLQRPDLVLTDVMMPRLDGFALLRQLRADPQTHDIPILLLSARAGEEAAIKGLEAGADDYLVKPFNARELLARVATNLEMGQSRQAERRQTEAALRQTEERYRMLFESIDEGFCVIEVLFDKNNTPLDYRFLETNPAFEKQTGLTNAQGKSMRELVPNHEEHWFEIYGNIALTGKPIRFENRAEALHRWYDVYAFRMGQPEDRKVAVLFSDITDRKQSEAALQESEQRFRCLVESNMFGVASGRLTGEFHYANDYFLNMVGYTHEEVEAGQLCWRAITPPEFLPLDERAGEELKLKGVATPFEKEYIRKDGTRVPVLIGSVLFQSPHTQQQEVIAFYLNLTERKQAETEREQLLQQAQTARETAERANRLKDEFLAVLSHELRSPLNPILGWIKLLRGGRLDAVRTGEALSTIERNAQLQAQLIEDLLDISRIMQGKLTLNATPVSLAFVISTAIETVQLAADAKAIQLKTSFESTSHQVYGDVGRLQQVVWNLLSNAVKFTPTGGRVEVRLEAAGSGEWGMGNGEKSIHSRLPTPDSPSSIQIIVTDTGKGISPEFLPYVFEHFRQEDGATTRKFGGLGLGLAIARQIVELHGGRIWVESPGEDQGATFTVSLPLLESQESSIEKRKNNANAPRSTPHSPLAGIRVLVADDDPDSRAFVTFVVEQAGADVIAVPSAIEALQTLQTTRFDLLLSDIGMPEMDGYMLMQQVRTLPVGKGGAIPAIALTAYAGEFDQQQALSVGFQQHVPKPVDPDGLIRAIVTLLGKAMV